MVCNSPLYSNLVLLNPDRPCAVAGEYECGRCAAARTGARVTADCGATLIVCPAPILRQWHDEIRRHTHEGARPPARPDCFPDRV